MGKESREREEEERVGQFNVKITLLQYVESLNVMKEEVVYCKRWLHTGPFLALNLFTGAFRVVCLQQYNGFEIRSIDQQTLDDLNEEPSLRH